MFEMFGSFSWHGFVKLRYQILIKNASFSTHSYWETAWDIKDLPFIIAFFTILLQDKSSYVKHKWILIDINCDN